MAPTVAAATDEELAAPATGCSSAAEVRADQRAAEPSGRVQAALIQQFGDDFAGAFLTRGGPARCSPARVDAVLIEHTDHSLAELQSQTDGAMETLAEAGFPPGHGLPRPAQGSDRARGRRHAGGADRTF